MFGKKKGQAAMEYLMTYGWAILAVVIVGGVLYYYGVFDPAIPDRACPDASIAVGHNAWSIDTVSNNLSVVAENMAAETVTITEISGDGSWTGEEDLGVADSVMIDEIGLDDEYGVGDRVDIEIRFEYQTDAGLERTSTCTITGEL